MDTDADRAFLEEFIGLYKSRPVLWDNTGTGYMTKPQKQEAHQEMLTLMRQYRKNSELFDVKRKINSLRGSFKREYRKQLRLQAAGVKYTPTLWWYDSIAFLRPTLKANELKQESGRKADDVATDEPESPPPRTTAWQPSSHDDADEDDCALNEMPAERPRDDEYRVIADAWAMKLRKLPPDQQVFAEKFISDILFEGQMCTLHRNSMQLNAYPATGKNEAIEEFEHMNV